MSSDPALFHAVIDEHGDVQYAFPAQQRGYCKRLAGQAVDVWIAPAGAMKTRLQEKALHAMVRPWVQDGGHRIEDLKRFLLGEIFGWMEAPHPITGEVVSVLVEPHTSRLNRAQYSEFIERTLEIAAEQGYVLEAPHEYTERKARESRKKEQAA